MFYALSSIVDSSKEWFFYIACIAHSVVMFSIHRPTHKRTIPSFTFYLFFVFIGYGSEIHLVETDKRQRKPRSAKYREAWELILPLQFGAAGF